jgi:hypothetical protein
MKTILVLVAAMGFSVSVAAAECAGHAKVTTTVDTETKVASVAQQTPPLPAEQSTATQKAAESE